ncbi:MAG TPA: two-component sensor histidine kinase, partial [Ochrobactrum sp.]|nr:two-component sensor histidine kinase [Ochrobactrum sp.]
MVGRAEAGGIPGIILDAINQPVIMVSTDNHIVYANMDAEQFFRSGSS